MPPDHLAIPHSSDELYDARGDEVSLACPLMPGDIFDELEIPGFDGTGLAMIIQHPCSMRAGKLRPRLTAIQVAKSKPIELAEWPNKYYDYMPLPELIVDDPAMYAACFRDIGSVKSINFDLRKRVACLSQVGLLYLLQRQVFCQTRVVVDLETLLEEIESVLEEAEIQQDWAELALQVAAEDADPVEVVRQVEVCFQQYLGPADSDHRQALRDRVRRVTKSRELKLVGRQRYRSSDSP